jgi:alkanesulfonate monooxygenase SsuD/methylene tetrahydromethanopterin reductase-like flavin-dependent oxidoreductase (luciferase family)
MDRPRLGVMYRRHLPPERLGDMARLVEAEGLDEMWVVEDCFWAGGMTAATAALAATETLTVGLGIAPAVVRNAAMAAMEVAGIARMFPGRFIAGFGHGVTRWMAQIGALPESQLAALEETLVVVRRLLAGERCSLEGAYVCINDVQLVFPPAMPPPLLCGAVGPRSLEMSGRVADGVVLPEGSSPAYIRAAIARMDQPGAACVVYVLFAVADDPREAHAAVQPALDLFTSDGLDTRLAALGVNEAVSSAERVERYAIAGTPQYCAAAIRELYRAGAQSVVLVPQLADQDAQIRRAAREVLPLL